MLARRLDGVLAGARPGGGAGRGDETRGSGARRWLRFPPHPFSYAQQPAAVLLDPAVAVCNVVGGGARWRGDESRLRACAIQVDAGTGATRASRIGRLTIAATAASAMSAYDIQ